MNTGSEIKESSKIEKVSKEIGLVNDTPGHLSTGGFLCRTGGPAGPAGPAGTSGAAGPVGATDPPVPLVNAVPAGLSVRVADVHGAAIVKAEDELQGAPANPKFLADISITDVKANVSGEASVTFTVEE